MQMLMNSTGGLGLLFNLNLDRILYLGVLTVALGVGTVIGTLLTQ